LIAIAEDGAKTMVERVPEGMFPPSGGSPAVAAAVVDSVFQSSNGSP
jgi:hypothetical protein